MRLLASVAFAALVLASPMPRVAATSSNAPAAPSVTPDGFSAHMTLSIMANGAKGQLALRGVAACERRGGIFRLDLQSLALEGGSKGVTVPNLTPSGGYSIAYDTSSMTYTIWAPARRTYYTGKGKPP